MSNATRIVASAATALALAAPAAQARPAVEAPAYDTAPVVTTHSGFDWGDAAIGGGAVLGLVALMSAGAAVTVRARTTPAR